MAKFRQTSGELPSKGRQVHSCAVRVVCDRFGIVYDFGSRSKVARSD